MGKNNLKKGGIAGAVFGVTIAVASVAALWMNSKNKSLEDVKNDIKKTIGDTVNSDSFESENKEQLLELIGDNKCICDCLEEEYSDWERRGYSVEPTKEYDSENVSGKLGIYGEPNAQQSFKDEVGMLWSSIFVTLRPNSYHRVYATP